MIRFLLLCLCLVAVAAGDADADMVTMKDGKTRSGWVESETGDETVMRYSREGQPQRLKTRDIRSIAYGFERVDGFIKSGRAEMDRGKYEAAAALFASAAAGGAREPERVWGAWFEAEAYEALKDYASAATAFAKIPAAAPQHRLALDAIYRQGFALALAKDAAGAGKSADQLAQLGVKDGRAKARENAVRAALAANAGDQAKLKEFSSRATFSKIDEPSSWIHFSLWRADALRAAGQTKDAVRIYTEVQKVVDDPALASRLSLNVAMAQMDTDPDAALVELLRLDALPQGSPDHKAEARLHAGRLLLDAAKRLRANPDAMKDERRAAFAGEQEATARMLLQAAADSPDANPDLPARAQARSLLDSAAPATSATGAAKP
jgi:tetratricopeptide (TPR) repeat protein